MKTRFHVRRAEGISGLSPMRLRFNRAVTIPARIVNLQVRRCVKSKTHDQRLLRMAGLLGMISFAVEAGPNHQPMLRDLLRDMFSFSHSWLSLIWPKPGATVQINAAIFAERKNQDELRRTNPKKYPFAMSSPIPDPSRKFRVLFEECGEVADAVDKLEVNDEHAASLEHMRGELVQVCAVCEAWLESYEVAA